MRWVTDMWAQRASGPHVSDTPTTPTVKSDEWGIDVLESDCDRLGEKRALAMEGVSVGQGGQTLA